MTAFRCVIGSATLWLHERVTTTLAPKTWRIIFIKKNTQPIRYSIIKPTNRIFENRDQSLICIQF